MRKDIVTLGYKREGNPFSWEAYQELDEYLMARYPYDKPKVNWVNILAEYCWQAYQKSFNSVGVMYIGRQHDVCTQAIMNSCSIGNGEDLWAPHTKGNILVMNKWSCVLNDTWLLGGVHRYADFQVMSYLAPQNLWDYDSDRHVVTARELLGLLHFGYEMKGGGILSCACFDDANNANLISYDQLMKREHMKNTSSFTRLLAEPSFGLYKQIHARSKYFS